MEKRQEFLDKLIQLEKEYNMEVTSDVGRIGVYIDDKTTNELVFFDEETGKVDSFTTKYFDNN